VGFVTVFVSFVVDFVVFRGNSGILREIAVFSASLVYFVGILAVLVCFPGFAGVWGWYNTVFTVFGVYNRCGVSVQ